MQGRTENVLSSTDKLRSLQKKLGIWKRFALDGNLEMFPLVFKTKWQEILPLILQHLTSLQEKIEYYFPVLLVEDYDLVRNPFIAVASKGQMILKEEEELTDILHDRTLKLKHCELSLDSFWISVENEYTTIAQNALKICCYSQLRICVNKDFLP